MRPIKSYIPYILLTVLVLFPRIVAAQDSATPSPTPSNDVTATQTPEGKAQSNINRGQDFTKALVVHKPMPSPSWGKVIQYHRETNFALADQNRETLHEFLFQDDAGVIRTAIFHESTTGEGYWEVWIWDQK